MKPLFLYLMIPIFGLILTLWGIYMVSCYYTINITPSAPYGLYRTYPPDHLRKGDIVIFDVPNSVRPLIKERNYMPPPLGSMLMKKIVGKPGDLIQVSENGCYINTTFFGKVKRFDQQGRPLPTFKINRQLYKDEFFMGFPLDNSLDSRIFGPITKASIKGIVHPVFVF